MLKLRKLGPTIREIAPYVGTAAAFLTLIFAFERFWGPAKTDARFGMALLALYALVFLGFSVYQAYTYSHRARYAESLHHLHRIYRLCNAALGENCTRQVDIIDIGARICNHLSDIFTITSNTYTAACIKVLESTADKDATGSRLISVNTLCRDSASTSRQAPGEGSEVIHWLVENTDFLEMFETILKPGGGTFFSNNLPREPDYRNTSFKFYDDQPGRRNIRRKNWSLPYKSTIGAPIFPQNPRNNPQLSRGDLLGFLCVDSASVGAFSRRYDLLMLRAFSAALHPVMLKWFDFIERDHQDAASVALKT